MFRLERLDETRMRRGEKESCDFGKMLAVEALDGLENVHMVSSVQLLCSF